MPKRRVTSKQQAASRRNLVKARAAKGKVPRSEYGGKMVTLYHRTGERWAGRIVRDGFNVGGYGTQRTFGSTVMDGHGKGYGHSIVSFKANRHHLLLDEHFADGERWYSVRAKNIKRSSIKLLTGKRVR